MNPALLSWYIQDFMTQRGIEKYSVQYRERCLPARESLMEDVTGQWLFLLDTFRNVRVESEYGIYTPIEESINERVYEHTGEVTFRNNMPSLQYVAYLLVIPHPNASPQNG